jgi:hypothetical protein
MNQNIRLAANVDADGKLIYINNDYLSWTGYDAAELIGESVLKLRAPSYPKQIQTTIYEQMRKNQSVQFPVQEAKKMVSCIGPTWLFSLFLKGVFIWGIPRSNASLKTEKRLPPLQSFISKSNKASCFTLMVTGLVPQNTSGFLN